MKSFFATSACVVITGLPGSGKSTLGREIARHLNAVCLDKDDYLEDLFDQRGIGDENWRRSLSDESNHQFQSDAIKHDRVVLVSHWRPPNTDASSGTPSEWLAEHYAHRVELYCACPVDRALQRFTQRQRHPGHLDAEKTSDQLQRWFRDYANQLPLGLGQLETYDSDGETPLDRLPERLHRLLPRRK